MLGALPNAALRGGSRHRKDVFADVCTGLNVLNGNVHLTSASVIADHREAKAVKAGRVGKTRDAGYRCGRVKGFADADERYTQRTRREPSPEVRTDSSDTATKAALATVCRTINAD